MPWRCLCASQVFASSRSKSCRKRRAVPSSSTLYRHRLSLHIGFCQWIASVHHELLNDAEGIIRWSTVDSSPQGGWDWLLSGSAVLQVVDSSMCFHWAQELIAIAAAGDDDQIGEQRRRQSASSSRIVLVSLPSLCGLEQSKQQRPWLETSVGDFCCYFLVFLFS